MKEKSLLEELLKLKDSDLYPFHMPGHKRQISCELNPYEIDITEIENYDNLHHATGVLANLQNAWAKKCGSEEAFLLINGSSGGILSSIYASTKEGDHALIARNSHKSVYHAAYLRHLKVSYLYPDKLPVGINAAITPKQVADAFDADEKIKLVVITSPTYDGIISDIEAIAQITHEHGATLIVDAAHGAHFGLHKSFPDNAAMKAADFCVISLHKTLPSPTQSALLLKNGNRVSSEIIKDALGIFETSSPSYVMMAAMEYCLLYCEDTGENSIRFEEYERMLDEFYEDVKDLKYLQVYSNSDKNYHDRTKILIFTNGIKEYSGEDLIIELRESYHIECEMAAVNYVIALSTFMDTKEGLHRLSQALKKIDERLSQENVQIDRNQASFFGESRLYLEREKVYDLFEADQMEKETVPIDKAAGRICGEYVYLYPPGIPVIAKGERIPDYFAEEINKVKSLKLELNGMSDYHANAIKVLKIG